MSERHRLDATITVNARTRYTASENDTSLSSGSIMGKPTARRCDLKIPFVKGQQRSVVAAVRSLHRGDIFFSNPAFILDRLLRPFDRSVSPSLQPNICEQSSPSPVAVSERMNPHSPMMQADGLFNERKTFVFMPRREVIEEVLQVVIDLIGRKRQNSIPWCVAYQPTPILRRTFPHVVCRPSRA